MVPIFRQQLRNARLVQIVGSGNTISGFEPADFQDMPMRDIEGAPATLSDPPYFAFAFDGQLIVGNDADARARLGELLDSTLSNFPLLACEVSEFLGLDVRRDEFARQAFERLAQVSQRAADEWRDFSIFTADVRQGLLDRLGADAHWPRRILATIEGRAVLVQGFQEAPSRAVSRDLRAAIIQALERSPRLFDGLRDITLGFAPAVRELNRAFTVRLVVDREFDIDLLRWRLRRVGRAGIDLVSWDSEEAFSPQGELPTVILLRGVKIERALEAAAGVAPRNTVAISYRVSNQLELSDDTAIPENMAAFIELPIPGKTEASPGVVRNSSVVFVAVEIAAAVLTGRYAMPQARSMLLAAGTIEHSDSATDAAENYDQAWAWGLVPWNATHFFAVEPDARPADTRAVLAALYAGTPEILSSSIAGDRDHLWSTSVLLLSAKRRSEADFDRHCGNIAQLMRLLGWQVLDGAAGSRKFTIQGAGARLTLHIADPVRQSDVDPPEPLRRPKFDRVSTIRVTCRATKRSIIRHLFLTRELAVNIEDLVSLDPATATIWSLIAVLLRRMRGVKPDQYRSLFVAYVVKDAIAKLGDDAGDFDAIREGIAAKEIGTATHFLIDRTIVRKGALRAKVRMVAGTVGTGTPPAATFILQVAAEGPSIETYRPD
ncbi:MAG: hypothetical protein KF730_03360 [Sphingomonas sp.]|uniref:hypothetical protein n=1 Tax=Sphingomonas sp. TaxID=28214 RepID=UPI0025D659B0|nr:hypothetical protein [Sphingomonas sp.]MBX3563596.1 hypothetical protein [Sphingomonas sp.]